MRYLFTAVSVLAVCLPGCRTAADTPSESGLTVFVSITPQKHFVERIAGDLADVLVMVEPGYSPATYEPRPAGMAALQQASLYFAVGVPFEDVWLDRIAASNPDMRIVDTSRGVERVVREHDHDHGVPDPHIWLSPSLVEIQAGNIARALQEADPENASVYGANLEEFIIEIRGLSREIRELLDDLPTRKFMVFHPAWGYFADEFHLEMIAVERGGREPSPRELSALIALAMEEDIRMVLAQPEFSTDAARVIAREIGGTVILLSPLMEDWTGAMRSIAETLAGRGIE